MSAFKPFPVGTVRGPYTCGKGNDPQGGTQYLVQTPGGWVPFISSRWSPEKARAEAQEYAKKVLAKEVAP